MSQNKKNFLYYQFSSGIIFLVGVLYTLLPTIYGIDKLSELNVNDLYLTMTLILASLNLFSFYVVKKNPTSEYLYFSMTASLCGLVNILISSYFSDSLTLTISILALTITNSIVRLFTIDYYHDKKHAFYYVEALLAFIYIIVGMIISVSVFNSPVIETMELGFFMIIMGIIESVKGAIKCLFKARRFLNILNFR